MELGQAARIKAGHGVFGGLVAAEGDPLADIDAAVYNVKWVMKVGGVVADKTKTQLRQ